MAESLEIEARRSVRNVGFLMVQRMLSMLGSLLFGITVPRLMGPEDFGRYTLLNSLSFWIVILAGMGLSQVIARQVPVLVGQGDPRKFREFVGDLMNVRIATTLLGSLVFMGGILLWLPDMAPLVALLMAVTTGFRSVGALVYGLFIGLNQTARWGLNVLLRGWFSLLLIPAGFMLGGLNGAIVGLLLAEGILLATGLWMGRKSIGFTRPSWMRVKPHLGMGAVYFVATVVGTIITPMGSSLLRGMLGDYAEAGYFGLASEAANLAGMTTVFITTAFMPLFTLMVAGGDFTGLKSWIASLMKGFGMFYMFCFIGISFFSEEVIPLVLGQAYLPVAGNLLPFVASLLVLSIDMVGQTVAVASDRPGVVLESAIFRVLVFAGLAVPAVLYLKSMGICLALLASAVVSALWTTGRLQSSVRYSLWPWIRAVALGLPLAFLSLVPGTLSAHVVLFVLSIIVYMGLIFITKTLTMKELRYVWQALKSMRRHSE